jgi:iron complex outermembrane recepter protein
MRLQRATLLSLPLVLSLGGSPGGAEAGPQDPKTSKDPKAADQAAAAEKEKKDKPVSLVEEITVTAQKREESLQDVPVTMQAFTGAQLDRFQVRSINEVVKLAPNLNVVVQNALSQHIMIRGVGTNEFFGNAPSSVGTYMDDVTMNSSYTSTLGLFDMERVEVLRGPQNTLFGRNTTGGAVNYITKQPGLGGGPDAYATATYGSHNLIDLEGASTIHLGPTAAARLAGKLRDRDGRWNNITLGDKSYGDSQRVSVRGGLSWTPSTSTLVNGSFHLARDDSQAQPQKAFGTLSTATPPGLDFLDEQTIFGSLGNSDIRFDQPVPFVTSQNQNTATTNWADIRTGGSRIGKIDVTGGYVKVDHNFGKAKLTSITSYDVTKGKYEEDNGVSGLSAGPNHDGLNQEALVINFDTTYKQFSQELRLASAGTSDRFRWVTGLYFFNENSTQGQNIRFGDNGVLLFRFLSMNDNAFKNTMGFSIAELKDRSYAAYGQADGHFSDNLTFTAGLRLTRDEKKNPSYYGGSINITGIPQSTYYDNDRVRSLAARLGPCPNPFFFTGCAQNDTSRSGVRADINASELGGKAGLQWHMGSAAMLYGIYSHGFKSGRYDVEFLHTAATPFPQSPIRPEFVDSGELGLKSTLWNRKMLVNTAIFLNHWKDQQVFNVGATGPVFSNLPASQIFGGELELKASPDNTWLLTASLGLLHSEITDATGLDFDKGEGEYQKGHALALVPAVSANMAIAKDVAVGASRLTLQADGRYQGKSKVKYKPSHPIDEYESRFVANLRADLGLGPSRRYTLSAYLENVTGAQFCLEKQDLHVLVGAYYCVPNEGQVQFGLQARVGF